MGSTAFTEELRVPAKLKHLLPDGHEVKSKNKSTIIALLTAEQMAGLAAVAKAAGKDVDLTDAQKEKAVDLGKKARQAAKRLKLREQSARALDLTQHPLGAAVPAMTDEEYDDLVQSMETRGFLPGNHIVMHEGMVLDGWHRYKASIQADVVAEFADYQGEDPAGFVLALNVERRHLSDDQRAAIAGALVRDGELKAEEAADRVKVSANQASKARRLAGHSDHLVDLIRSGHMSIADGMDVIRHEDSERLVDALEAAGENLTTVQRIIAEAKEARAEKRESQRASLTLTGDRAWSHVDFVFDSDGNLLGEGYVRERAPEPEDIDPHALVARIENVLAPNKRADRSVIRRAIKAETEEHELSALYYGFENVMPAEGMSRAKVTSSVVNRLVSYWEADVEDEDEDEDNDEDED